MLILYVWREAQDPALVTRVQGCRRGWAARTTARLQALAGVGESPTLKCGLQSTFLLDFYS